MTTLIKFIVGLLAATMFTSCVMDFNMGQVQGNGNVQTEDMNISEDFNEVTASRGWEVFLEKGTANSVIVEADENLLDLVDIYVKDGDLKISSEKNINKAASKKVYVTYTDNLEELNVNSGASITTKEALQGNKLNLDASSGGVFRVEVMVREVNTDVSSGGVVQVQGETQRHIVSASSGGVIKANELKAEYANADVSSGGVIRVYASDKIDADASSGGTINYYGNPKEVNKPSKNYSGGVIRAKQ